MDEPVFSMFLALALMVTWAYALSAAGRRWRRGFSKKSLDWLLALERNTTTVRWTILALGLCILAGHHLISGAKQHPDPRLAVVIVGIIAGIGNLLWELSNYASVEIEVRKRLPTR